MNTEESGMIGGGETPKHQRGNMTPLKVAGLTASFQSSVDRASQGGSKGGHYRQQHHSSFVVQGDASPQKRNLMSYQTQSQSTQDDDEMHYKEAKKLRLQIEKDVMMLRNRVRMLQIEEQKAIKKINETKTKTQQILDLKERNDRQYQHQMMQDRINQSRLKYNQ